MRRLLLTILLLWSCALPLHAAEVIRSFTSVIEPQTDGSFIVDETIEYSFGSASRHGIFRTLEKQHPDPASSWLKERVVHYEVLSVRANDSEVPFELTENGDELEIKIGDPNKLVSESQTYHIRYRVLGGLIYPEGLDPELYYNVTGHQWSVPILRTEAVVKDTAGMLIPRRACYMGVEGSNASCTITASTTSVSFSAGEMAVGGGLTIAQALNGGMVAKQVVETTSWWVILLPLLGFIGLFAVWFGYRTETKHKKDIPVVAQYEPFPEVLPMYTGVIMDGQLDAKDITAGLVHLAATGFIRIKRTEEKVLFFFEVNDYEVTLLRPFTETTSAFDVAILEFLFGPGAQVTGEPVRLKDIKADYASKARNQKALMALKAAIAEDVVSRGFYERVLTNKRLGRLGIIVALLIGGALFAPELVPNLMPGPIVFALFVTGLIGGILLASMYRRRTALGYAAKNHLEGFKEFLSVTDRERFTFHNAPEKNPEQFMTFLPYAIALGVEREWAEVFKDITIPTPEWYSGTDGAFSATAFASELGSFSSSFTSATATSPSSGGGSSGGGSGGGGGGSW